MSIQAVMDYLRHAGQPHLAEAVERLKESEQRLRRAAEKTLQDYYALQDKYEPRPPSPSCWKNNWTGD